MVDLIGQTIENLMPPDLKEKFNQTQKIIQQTKASSMLRRHSIPLTTMTTMNTPYHHGINDVVKSKRMQQRTRIRISKKEEDHFAPPVLGNYCEKEQQDNTDNDTAGTGVNFQRN